MKHNFLSKMYDGQATEKAGLTEEQIFAAAGTHCSGRTAAKEWVFTGEELLWFVNELSVVQHKNTPPAPSGQQPDCGEHRRDVFGQNDMKALAEEIGNLHYETLAELLARLEGKIFKDSMKDKSGDRVKLYNSLFLASEHLQLASEYITKAWQISKPYMDNKTNQ